VQFRANVFALLCCVLFLVLGLAWIERPGIQTDEALFSAGIYPPFDPTTTVRIFKVDYPMMVMTYVGSLKARLWAPIFAVWGPNVWTTRVPAVLLATLTVWLFYLLLRSSLGLRAAFIGTALLATDPVYLLTARYDWGPVVLQHVCLLAGLVALLRFDRDRRLRWIALGFFFFGLGLWDKALFVWSLVGLGVAALAVFPGKVWRALSFRTVAIAAAAFALGAFPLIKYNVKNDWITFRSNTVWITPDIVSKLNVVRYTLNGPVLFGYIMRDDWEQPKREAATALEKAAVAFNDFMGAPRFTFNGYLALLAMMLLPFVWRTPAGKAVLFALIFMLVTWLQMVPVLGGGDGAHHSILLWPMPLLAMAAVLSAVPWRRAGHGVAVVVGAACLSNVAVTSSYFTNLIERGGTSTWTEAYFPASEYLKTAGARQVCIYDWGFWDNLRLLHGGRLPLAVLPMEKTPEAAPTRLSFVSDPGSVFIAYTEGQEVTPGLTAELIAFAAANGYVPADRRTFNDSNGRAIIQTFRFRALETTAQLQPTARR
jgi:hypothetical protein